MSEAEKKPGGGFAALGLLTGLAAGLAAYALIDYGVDKEPAPFALAALAAIVSLAVAFLLLAERGATLRAILPAAVIALILAGPTYHVAGALQNHARLDPFPGLFWIVVGSQISAFLMTTLAKASLMERAPPPYRAVFFHGVTLPLIAAGAYFFAVLAAVLLLAWAALLKSMDVDLFQRLFREPWFMAPFLGAIGGLSIAMMRGLESVLGALRFVLLLFCRIAMPITAVFSLTFVAVLATKGPAGIFIGPTPGGLMLALAFVGMLIFNGVYQNGEGEPPSAWLRLVTIVSLLAFPVYSGLAAYALWLRVDQYGLTPERVIVLAATILAAAYSVVSLAGLVTEVNWTGKRWMPFVAPLNTLMAALWVVVLVALATPLFDPWALSARSQAARLIDGRVKASEFDYAYLRFRLGRHGERALDQLLTREDLPDYATIAAGVAEARARDDRGARALRPTEAPPPETDNAPAEPGLDDLPLDPGGEEADAKNP